MCVTPIARIHYVSVLVQGYGSATPLSSTQQCGLCQGRQGDVTETIKNKRFLWRTTSNDGSRMNDIILYVLYVA